MFDADGGVLRASIVERVSAAPFTVLGWEVADIAAAVGRLINAGVVFERYPWMPRDELGVWSAPSGARVAWLKDPDGNLLSVSQG